MEFGQTHGSVWRFAWLGGMYLSAISRFRAGLHINYDHSSCFYHSQFIAGMKFCEKLLSCKTNPGFLVQVVSLKAIIAVSPWQVLLYVHYNHFTRCVLDWTKFVRERALSPSINVKRTMPLWDGWENYPFCDDSDDNFQYTALKNKIKYKRTVKQATKHQTHKLSWKTTN